MPVDISEFAHRAADRRGTIETLQRPPLAVQPPIALTPGQTARTVTLREDTRIVRMTTTETVRARVYDVPAGTDATAASAAGTDGLSEIYYAGEHVIAFGQASSTRGRRLAVILAE